MSIFGVKRASDEKLGPRTVVCENQRALLKETAITQSQISMFLVILDFEPHGRLRSDDPPLLTNYVGHIKNQGLSFIPFCLHVLARYHILDY